LQDFVVSAVHHRGQAESLVGNRSKYRTVFADKALASTRVITGETVSLTILIVNRVIPGILRTGREAIVAP
jgi:hypothetical protein